MIKVHDLVWGAGLLWLRAGVLAVGCGARPIAAGPASSAFAATNMARVLVELFEQRSSELPATDHAGYINASPPN